MRLHRFGRPLCAAILATLDHAPSSGLIAADAFPGQYASSPTPLSGTFRSFVFVSGASCNLFRPEMLLHATQHVTAPAFSQYACCLSFANRVADVEHEAACCTFQSAYFITAWTN